VSTKKRRAATVEKPDHATVHFKVEQIILGAKSTADLQKMNSKDLSQHVHELEIRASEGRYILWKRHDAWHVMN
jgi:hypothetical protein